MLQLEGKLSNLFIMESVVQLTKLNGSPRVIHYVIYVVLKCKFRHDFTGCRWSNIPSCLNYDGQVVLQNSLLFLYCFPCLPLHYCAVRNWVNPCKQSTSRLGPRTGAQYGLLMVANIVTSSCNLYNIHTFHHIQFISCLLCFSYGTWILEIQRCIRQSFCSENGFLASVIYYAVVYLHLLDYEWFETVGTKKFTSASLDIV